ncbi:MAG: helix-turn-helix domain-containing protein, partial [Phyllobacterium sp.]
YKESDFRPAMEWINALPKERRDKIFAGAAATLEAMHLSKVRKALDVTQVDLAKSTGLKQGEISRIEHRTETVQLKTLEKYVRGLGGTVKIVADFPDGTHAEIPLRSGKPVKSRVTVKTSVEGLKRQA